MPGERLLGRTRRPVGKRCRGLLKECALAFDCVSTLKRKMRKLRQEKRETNMSDSAWAIRDSQCSRLGDGIRYPVVSELSSVRAERGQGCDNHCGVRNSAIPGSKSTSGRSQKCKAVLHIEL